MSETMASASRIQVDIRERLCTHDNVEIIKDELLAIEQLKNQARVNAEGRDIKPKGIYDQDE